MHMDVANLYIFLCESNFLYFIKDIFYIFKQK